MGGVRGKVALVTGGNRGIGAAIATAYAREGARVVVHGRDPDATAAVAGAIEEAGGQALAVLADLTDFDQVERLRAELEARFGPADIVIANAGGSTVRPQPVEEISPADWRTAIEVNLTATFLTVKSFLPGMKQRGAGVFITMSSAAARRPTPYSPIAYAAAKAGIQLFTQDLAAQAGPAGIRANCIAPETILTDRNKQAIPAEQQRSLIDAHPVRRLGTPEDIAAAALFLGSDQAAWISGVILDVAGGSVLV